MKFVVHEGKNRAAKCDCNSNWLNEWERTEGDISIVLFKNLPACPACRLSFWATTKRRAVRIEVVP